MSQTMIVRVYEEVADFFAQGPSQVEILTFHFSDETNERLRDLLYKNSAGTLSPEESQALDQVESLNRLLMLIRSQIER